MILDDYEEWILQTGEADNTIIVKDKPIGGGRDLTGNGALSLQKDSDDFLASSVFRSSGVWTSRWQEFDLEEGQLDLSVSMNCYGQNQDMRTGWKKFPGNPLVCQAGWHHATEQTLILPDSLVGQPADQALARGTGKWKGKWLLFFNIGGWAVNGWGMAVADSLAPIKRGINPFSIAQPYPLACGNGKKNIWSPQS